MCWGPEGDRFIIKDVVVFTVDILPRVFRYSNFASFVRQLNKFDFHKVRALMLNLIRAMSEPSAPRRLYTPDQFGGQQSSACTYTDAPLRWVVICLSS